MICAEWLDQKIPVSKAYHNSFFFNNNMLSCILRSPSINDWVSGSITGYCCILHKQKRWIAGWRIRPDEAVAAQPTTQASSLLLRLP